MRRREATLALLLLAALPTAGKSQASAKPYRIGFLGLTSAADYSPYLVAFHEGLADLGYEEGRNIVVEYRWAYGNEKRLAELARQLVGRNPDVLVSHAVGVSAAQQATSTIPIVMGASADPVAFGLIKTLGKPGGNTTGVASQIVDLASKRLELLKEATPKLKVVAVLSNPAYPATRRGVEEVQRAGHKLGVRVRSFDVLLNPAALESVFAAIVRERMEGLVVQPDPITGTHNLRIAAFAAHNRLPSIGGGRPFAAAGGLASYGPDFLQGWRMAARYVDKILKGAKPADLPVEQPGTFDLVINARTAIELGLTVPRSLLLRANEVIR